MISRPFGSVSQVVGIYPDAVSANQTRLKRQEISLGFGRFKYFMSIDVQAIKDHGQFVDEGDV